MVPFTGTMGVRRQDENRKPKPKALSNRNDGATCKCMR